MEADDVMSGINNLRNRRNLNKLLETITCTFEENKQSHRPNTHKQSKNHWLAHTHKWMRALRLPPLYTNDDDKLKLIIMNIGRVYSLSALSNSYQNAERIAHKMSRWMN